MSVNNHFIFNSKEILVHGQKILIFSPHPDDDVIGMGGVISKLSGENDLHIAYLTSGGFGVRDEDAAQYLKTLSGYRSPNLGDYSSAEIFEIKSKLRQHEAREALSIGGVRAQNLHFLHLPFYNNPPSKRTIKKEDRTIVFKFLKELSPDIIFMVENSLDPRGTHGKCYNLLKDVLRGYKKDFSLFIYQSIWDKVEPGRFNYVIGLDEQKLETKKKMILAHHSQDPPLWPGEDERSYWQRIKEANDKAVMDIKKKFDMNIAGVEFFCKIK